MACSSTMFNPSSSSSVGSPSEFIQQLERFRFPKDRIYSHKNETIVIDASSKDLLEEIINYEIERDSAKRNGFIVLHFHSDLQPIVTDESVMHFLRVSGEHANAKQKLEPWKYSYENVLMDNQEPSGILCSPKLIESVKTGARLRVLLDLEKPEEDKEDTENQMKGRKPRNKKSSKKGVGANKSRKKGNGGRRHNPPIVSKMVKSDLVALLPPSRKSLRLLLSSKTTEVKLQVPPKPTGPLVTNTAIITLDCEDTMPEDYRTILQRGKLLLAGRNEGDCFCRKDCKIADYKSHTMEKPSLMHCAYLGQLRIENIRKLYASKLPEPESGRPYCDELRLCEEILRATIDVSDKNNYNYQYMIHQGVIQLNTPEGGNFNGSSTRYDMVTHKNQVDECVNGEPGNGLSAPWTYVGFGGSIFAAHLEDMGYLNSLNFMAYGASKVWIFVPASEGERLQKMVVTYLNTFSSVKVFSTCTLQHKLTFIHPALLEMWNIRYKIVVQKPGQLIVTAAAAFHWGINLGVNINYSKNAIYHDYRMQMLKSLYMSCNDPFMCPPDCHQTPGNDVPTGVLDSFILSFYKTMFKSNPYNMDNTITCRTITSIFAAENDNQRMALLTEKNAYIMDKFKKRSDELVLEREDCIGKILKVIQRMTCDTVQEISGTVSFSMVVYEPITEAINLYPSATLKLSTLQQNKLFNQLPYTHIRVTYEERMSVPPSDPSKAGPHYKRRRTKLAQEPRYVQEFKFVEKNKEFQFFDDLRQYWTDVIVGKDYITLKLEDHNGMENGLEELKELSQALQQQPQKQQLKSVRGGESDEDDLSDDVSTDDSLIESEDIEDLLNTGSVDLWQEFLGDYGYKVIAISGHLQLVELNRKHWFVCGLCDKNLLSTLKHYVRIFKGVKTPKAVGAYLEQKIKRKSGVSADVSNMRHHISSRKMDHKCLTCGKQFRGKYTFASHLRSQHQNHMIHCPLCQHPFRDVSHLRRHWSDPATACVLVDVHISKKGQVEVLRFCCSKCNKFMNKIEQWKEHLLQSKSCKIDLGVPDEFLKS